MNVESQCELKSVNRVAPQHKKTKILLSEPNPTITELDSAKAVFSLAQLSHQLFYVVSAQQLNCNQTYCAQKVSNPSVNLLVLTISLNTKLVSVGA